MYMEIASKLNPPLRTLLGPGPSPVNPRVLEPAVAEAIRAPMINAIRIPEGTDDAKVRQRLYDEFNIEIGAGLGPLKGKVWRVGLMGHGARV
jgi:aspartate aminotransferase-like enzyme